MNCSITQVDQDNRLDTRVMDIVVDGKRIRTPAKTIEGKGQEGEFNEINLSATREGLMKANFMPRSKFNTISSRYNRDAINIIIPDYKDTSFSVGDKSVLSAFESRIHSYSDIIVVPRWSGILSDKTGELMDGLKRMTDQFLEESRTRNGKMIMGNIPLSAPDGIVMELVEHYMGKGITSFVLDYGTCLPLTRKYMVRDIYKTIERNEDSERSILYSVNVRRTHMTNGIYPADDLMTFVHGVDVIGGLHMAGGTKKDGPDIEPMQKKFVLEQFTYRECFVEGKKARDELKLSNNTFQNLAANEVSHQILDEGSAYSLLKEKAGAKEYLPERWRQTSLDLHFSF